MDWEVACPNGTRTATRQGVCTPKAFSVTRRLSSILLASPRLRTCRCTCRAGAGISKVDGSDPPVRGPGAGAGWSRACTRRPEPSGGRSLHSDLRTLSGIDITCCIQGPYGFFRGCPAPHYAPGKKRIPPALPGRVGTIGPDRIGTTGPQSEATIPVSPQAAGPAVPERKIGPATGSGVLWHARGLEMAACPAKLADSAGRTPSNALSTSMPSWIRSTRWRRQQPPRPERDGSIISASGGQGDGVV